MPVFAGMTTGLSFPRKRDWEGIVIPAQAGIQGISSNWMPAFAGMTTGLSFPRKRDWEGIVIPAQAGIQDK